MMFRSTFKLASSSRCWGPRDRARPRCSWLWPVLSGRIPASSGWAIATITRLAPNKRDIGIVFQNYALFPHMNVLANVAYPLALRKTPRAEARQRALATWPA